MSDTEYAAFKALGGADWLRERIRKMRIKNRVKAVRNRSMRIDASKGMSDAAIARKYNVDRSTVYRIVSIKD